MKTYTQEELEAILKRARDKCAIVIDRNADLIWAIHREAFGLTHCNEQRETLLAEARQILEAIPLRDQDAYIKQEIHRALTFLV